MANGTVLTGVRAGRIVRCVSVRRGGGLAYPGRLAVDPAERGAVIGRALLKKAESLARRMGLGRLRVETRLALAGNHAFFRAAGLAEGARRCHPGFDRPTYVELEKMLI
jgi:GNAT superfamily N-acetyltransferase